MKRVIIALALVCAACQTTRYSATGYDGVPRDKALAECEYEASAATANIRSGIEAGWTKAELRHKCMLAKGFRRET